MLRRTFVAVVAISLLTLPASVATGQPAKLPRIGYVSPAASFAATPALRAFLDQLRYNGYVEGRDFVIEFRSTGGRQERFADLSAELSRLPVDVLLVGVCGEPLDAARRATKTIPIVVGACNDDLVETGIVHSLNRPGGNITGLSKLTPELAAKRLELLKQTIPTILTVAVLWDPAYSDFKADWRELRGAASKLGITLHPVEFRAADQLQAAFAEIDKAHVDALITFSDQTTYIYAKRVAELTAITRVPAMFAFSEVPDAGGLMSYGPNIPDMFRQAAVYVIKILQGTKPADLPIQQAEKFDLVVNLKTAKELGIRIPQSVLLRADRVIQGD
ncbi:MAG TPA: ABC transporter substrate-binding protein [Casimicrobiaceae bacterium]